MTNKSLGKRLKELEKKTLQPIEPGSTKISIEDLPFAEKLFFKEVAGIARKLQIEDYTPSETEANLLMTVNKRLVIRAIDMFETAMKVWFRIDTEETKFLWLARFYYFLFEFSRHRIQVSAENKIAAANKSRKQYDKAWKKYKESLTDEEKIPLWTPKSFSHFLEKYVFVTYDEYVKREKEQRRKKVNA